MVNSELLLQESLKTSENAPSKSSVSIVGKIRKKAKTKKIQKPKIRLAEGATVTWIIDTKNDLVTIMADGCDKMGVFLTAGQLIMKMHT